MTEIRVGAQSWQRAVRTILWAGLVAGTLDLTAALIVYTRSGPAAIHLLQGIASGLIGKAAMDGGAATAALGVVCHFFIATSWAAIFYAASRRVGFLLEHPLVSGIVYGGVVVYGVMNHIVVPLSAIGPRPFTLHGAIKADVILVFCIGIPIAIIVRRFAALDSRIDSA